MKQSLRLLLVACAGFGALAFAGPALASYTPSVTIEQTSYKLGAATTADVFVFAPENDDPSAKLTLVSPAGYGVNLSQAPGTKLGSAVAIVRANALAGAHIALAGNVLMGNPSDPSIVAVSTRCTGSPTNQAVIVLNLTAPGQTQTVPFLVFVNKAGPVTTFQICVPHPDDAPFGAKVIALDATIKGMFTNPTASNGYEWSSLFTPYATGTKVPNPAGTIEWRTYVGLPASLTFKRVSSKIGLKFAGQLRIAGVTPRGIRVSVYYAKKPNPAPNAVHGKAAGAKAVRTARLPTSGKYLIKRPGVRAKTYFQARFENYLLNSCAPPSPAPQGCKGEDIAAMTSSQVRVLPRRRP
jgi:hypothetical protein